MTAQNLPTTYDVGTSEELTQQSSTTVTRAILPKDGGLSTYQFYNLRISEFYFKRPKVCFIKNVVTEATNKNLGGKIYSTGVYIFRKKLSLCLTN
jgi:hypothetical protein